MNDPFFSDAEKKSLSRTSGYSDGAAFGDVDMLLGDPGRAVYIFGAGIFGMETRELLSRIPGVGARLAGFVDSDPAKEGMEIAGLRVHLPGDPGIGNGNPLIVSACFQKEHEAEMRQTCRRLGYDCVAHSEFFYRYDHAAVRAGLDVWDDDGSRRLYRELVRHMFARDREALRPYAADDMYFPAFMPGDCYRSFVDAGAYVGDTLAEFRRRTGGDYDNYYAFEADPENYGKLALAAGGDERVRCYPVALHDARARLPFYHRNDSIRSLVGFGGAFIAADSLDSILPGNPVTFIKMDIEGAEPKALAGAKGIIASQRPALAICLYHRPDDLWRLPLWIKSVGADYRLRLEYYDWDYVCYAVPGGRKAPSR